MFSLTNARGGGSSGALFSLARRPFRSLIGISNAFNGIAKEKATGLAAVAGGLAEGYLTFGVALAFAMPITAIFLLSRSFARGHGVRSLFSLVCIGWNALMLALAGLFLWLYLVYFPRAGAHPR
jgi:hypothetical protein